MAKVKNPLMSLASHGTIGEAITFRRSRGVSVAESKPIPANPQSLYQTYQRWQYQDTAYRWTLLSAAEKQTYLSRASRYHITGFNLYMSEHLPLLPNVLARWHMDEHIGASVHDSGGNGLDAPIFGASPTTGRIAGGYYFDGLNDYMGDLTSAILRPSYIAVECMVNCAVGEQRGGFVIADISGAIAFGYMFGLTFGEWRSYIYGTLGYNTARTFVNANCGTWQHFYADYNGIRKRIWIDGVIIEDLAAVLGPLKYQPGRDKFRIGRSFAAEWLEGSLDEIIVYDANLPDELIKRHAERRWPVK